MSTFTQTEEFQISNLRYKIIFQLIHAENIGIRQFDNEKIPTCQIDETRFLAHVDFIEPYGTYFNIFLVKNNQIIKPTSAIIFHKGKFKYYPIYIDQNNPDGYSLGRATSEPPKDAFRGTYTRS